MRSAMIPFGEALIEYYYRGIDIPVVIVREDGYRNEMSVKYFFRMREKFSKLERNAIKKCKGKIVDLSAGVGADALDLQTRGFDVTAVEINVNACEILKKRGVKKVHCLDLFEFSNSAGIFDTILLFGRSIANVQNLEGLKKFLVHAKTLLNKNGQILLDSLDVRKTTLPVHIEYQKRNIEKGKYFGEITVRFEYKDVIGPNFELLHVDPNTLGEYCENTGWKCEILHTENEGKYLARLTQID